MPSNIMDFAEFALAILDEDPFAYPAVIKEVVHIESLRSMAEIELFRYMVFHGGTAIRLCHGGLRYSDDLDFSAIGEVQKDRIDLFFDNLSDKLQDLGLSGSESLEVSHKDLRDRGGVRSWRSQIAIPPPLENRPDIRSVHFIKIEVDDRKVLEPIVRPIEVRYSGLGQQGPLVTTKSIKELMVDKVIALIDRTTMKWRDVFDIHQLSSRGATLDIDMLKTKVRVRYSGKNDVEELVATRREELTTPDKLQGFAVEMGGLLPARERDKWLSPGVVEGISEDTQLVLSQVSQSVEKLNFNRGPRR